MPAPAGFRFQPVDTDEVAARLVELALGTPTGLVPDMAGPRVYEMADLLRGYLRARGKHRPIVPVRLLGKAARASGMARTWPRTGLWAAGPGRTSSPRRWARRAAADPSRHGGHEERRSKARMRAAYTTPSTFMRYSSRFSELSSVRGRVGGALRTGW